ncbi:MAG: hydrolase [Candidatus Aminicenantes bacterium]
MDQDICCPKFDPAPWDDKTHEWKDKKFVRDKVRALFNIPMNFGAVVRRLDGKIREAGATVPDYLGLSNHTSKWSMDMYVAVDKDVPGADNVTLSGKFFSKVYEGAFKDTGKWCEDFAAVMKERGLASTKQYMWYTTCPKCAKKYGKNYVVIFGQSQ